MNRAEKTGEEYGEPPASGTTARTRFFLGVLGRAAVIAAGLSIIGSIGVLLPLLWWVGLLLAHGPLLALRVYTVPMFMQVSAILWVGAALFGLTVGLLSRQSEAGRFGLRLSIVSFVLLFLVPLLLFITPKP